MDMLPRLLPGDPAGIAGSRGDLAVQRHRGFQGHQGGARRMKVKEGLVLLSGPDLKQALRDQLGLRLVEKKGPVEFLLVKHIEKLPAEN